MKGKWLTARGVITPRQTAKLFPAQSPQMLFLSLDKFPGEYLTERKRQLHNCLVHGTDKPVCHQRKRESRVKKLPEMQETWIWSLGWEDPREEGITTHSSIRAWRIPGPEEPGGLPKCTSWRPQPKLLQATCKVKMDVAQEVSYGNGSVALCFRVWPRTTHTNKLKFYE